MKGERTCRVNTGVGSAIRIFLIEEMIDILYRTNWWWWYRGQMQ